jgi:hypothetical protein
MTTQGGSLEERHGRDRKDVVGVRRVEVGCAVDLDNVSTAGLVAGNIDAGEVEPERGDRAERKLTRRGRRTHAPAGGAQSDVRAPFAGYGTALDRADDAVSGDEKADVAARRLDE